MPSTRHLAGWPPKRHSPSRSSESLREVTPSCRISASSSLISATWCRRRFFRNPSVPYGGSPTNCAVVRASAPRQPPGGARSGWRLRATVGVAALWRESSHREHALQLHPLQVVQRQLVIEQAREFADVLVGNRLSRTHLHAHSRSDGARPGQARITGPPQRDTERLRGSHICGAEPRGTPQAKALRLVLSPGLSATHKWQTTCNQTKSQNSLNYTGICKQHSKCGILRALPGFKRRGAGTPACCVRSTWGPLRTRSVYHARHVGCYRNVSTAGQVVGPQLLRLARVAGPAA